MSLDWAHPLALLLLPVLGVGWLLLRGRRRPAAVAFSHLQLWAGLPRGGVRRAIWLGRMLRVGVVTLAVVALAQPRTPDSTTRLPTEGIAILFVLDVSPSMEEKFDWSGETVSRLEAARRAFRAFVEGGDGPGGVRLAGRSTERGTDAIGLVTFAIWPEPACPLTLDHRVLLQTLTRVGKRAILDTNTNIGDAIAEGVIRLEQSTVRRRVMILLSDGEHNFFQELPDRDPPLKPRQAAQLAANLNIPIYAIDAGGDPPATDPERAAQRRDGRAVSEAVARMTGGRFFTANDGEQLLQAIREIDRLERQPILSFAYRRYREHFPWVLGLALLLLASLAYLERFRWRLSP